MPRGTSPKAGASARWLVAGGSGGLGRILDGRGAGNADLDLPGLRLLGHRDGRPQHAPVVVGLDTISVVRPAEEQPPCELPCGALGHQDLVVLLMGSGSLGLDGEDV